MPADRFFVENLSEALTTVELSGQEYHHLAHVMRIAVGEEVSLVDGQGSLAKAQVSALARSSATLTITHYTKQPKAAFECVLAQAIPRMSRLESIVEKGTELGVTKLWLFPATLSERSAISQAQQARLKSVAVSAVKQCGRLYLPDILIKPPLDQWKEERRELPLFFGDVSPSAPSLLQALPKPLQGVVVFIGPESGFTQEEEALMKERGAKGVRLHRNILRTDTASLAALSVIEQLLL